MNNKEMLVKFIRMIQRKKLLTLFIENIFDYENMYEYNYIFRMINDSNRVVIDIYDNISINRFNRYIFIFDDIDIIYKVLEENNVFVHYINVLKIDDNSNKLIKLAYLFKLDKSKMIMYANTFLNQEFIDILKKLIKK